MQYLVNYFDYLQSSSMVVHEAQIYDVVIANIGSRQLENDIDVYLTPLIEDLKIIWEEKVAVFYAYHQENFKLQTILLWTINDFSAYENLSGYSVKGYKACPVCKEDTFSLHLKHSRKTVYLGFQRFLPMSHHYRRPRKGFNGSTEEESAPKILTREEVYQHVNHLRISHGKEKKIIVEKMYGRRGRLIFFYLPHRKFLFVRHYH